MNRAVRIIAAALGVLALLSCSTRQAMRMPDPEIVQMYTGGMISRSSAISVTFTQSRAVEAGTAVSPSPFHFSPSIPGSARWADGRTLEFVPASPLPAGQAYRASVTLEGMAGFDFSFAVLKPRFDVSLGGLTAAAGKKGEYSLEGSVKTADTEDPKKVESLVIASLHGRKLSVEWTHDADSLLHTFRVSGIAREEKPAVLSLSWAGRPIGSAVSGRKDIPVPSLKDFSVLDVRAMSVGEERFIEVGFSDPLRPRDLTGLIGVTGRTDVRLAPNGNRVRLYALSPWRDSETVTIEQGIQNEDSSSLVQPVASRVTFTDQLPQVKFVGSGVILPSSTKLTVPIETMNLRSVIVEAFQIYGDNMAQFLQVNNLEGTNELYRVGKVVWRKVIPLDFTDDQKNTWVRHGLDVSALVKEHPDGMFQLRVSFRPPHIVWTANAPMETDIDWDNVPLVRDGSSESSYWDYWESEYSEEYYQNRNNPYHPAYYTYYSGDKNVLALRNILVSDIGLIAKGEPTGVFHVFSVDLKTAQSLPGVKITLLDFQQKVLATGTTDKDGMAKFSGVASPSFVFAEKSGQNGYLKVDNSSALVTSHLDVGGEQSRGGVKGFLYGERGVWRPGDPIYLTFILSDPQKTLPAGHPVIMELRDPRGQVSARYTKTSSMDGFYSFQTQTSADAPTGAWEARVKVGDRTFSKEVRVEAVMPNRLKLEFNVPTALEAGPFRAALQASWLYGAPAGNMNAEVKLQLAPTPTVFEHYADYIFDDPARTFSAPSQTLYEGTLDSAGKASVSSSIDVEELSAGKLQARFQVRVFEPGGSFSTEQFSQLLSPYDQYVGIRVPKGDAMRGMLLTDTDHSVRIVLVDPAGNPVKSGRVQAEIYKIEWRWWWEKGDEDLAEYVSERSLRPILSDKVTITNGEGEWKMRIKYPDWGRYLIRVKDLDGGHSTGKVVYIDWPGWAGRASEGKIGASMLTLTADKPTYSVGEKATVTFPSNAQGRALVSLEKSGRVISSAWVTPAEGTTKYTFTTTSEMAPNIYVHVTFVQPHLQTANDLPIRLYGIVPVMVEDSATHLTPRIASADSFAPSSKATVSVSEAGGREMTYTLALVDEGLLRINRYETPDPWNVFYRREASMLKGWDLYDMVAGAYAGKLENLLAVGGGEDLDAGGDRKANRFPPIVKFIGPVTLKKGETKTHQIDIPQYVGAVRLMVVAGHDGAFGRVEKEVQVKSDLMVLPTLPRVLSPGEEIDLPVSVFVTSPDIKTVTLKAEVSGPVAITGVSQTMLAFAKPEEKLAKFHLKVADRIGLAKVRISADGKKASFTQDIEIDVRMPVNRQTEVITATIQPGKSWEQDLKLPGVALTNTIQIEASRLPPLDLGKNLNYLIQYPHGCIEQTTSSVFPQVSLDKIVELSAEQAARTQRNIEAGIKRLSYFQTPSGGFAYWPGEAHADEWGSNYAGHFLLEAKARGFALPTDMMSAWTTYQTQMAESWMPGDARGDLNQAYRLYTLALAGSPSIGAMNRLRELSGLSTTARWRLAAAYQLAGQKDAARTLTRNLGYDVAHYVEMSDTYGSDLRDRGVILESMCILGVADSAQKLAEQISSELSAQQYYGTQTTAYALLGLMRYGQGTAASGGVEMSWSWGGSPVTRASTKLPVLVQEVAPGSAVGGKLLIRNEGKIALYPRIITQGLPPMGSEKATQNGISLNVDYEDDTGSRVDPANAESGKELVVTIDVQNTSRTRDYQQLALSYLLPGGWEMAAARLQTPTEEGTDGGDNKPLYDYQDIRDDRVLTYFSLNKGESKQFVIRVIPTYGGVFYQPSISVEAMYDPTVSAQIPGKWLKRK